MGIKKRYDSPAIDFKQLFAEGQDVLTVSDADTFVSDGYNDGFWE